MLRFTIEETRTLLAQTSKNSKAARKASELTVQLGLESGCVFETPSRYKVQAVSIGDDVLVMSDSERIELGLA